MSRLGWFDFCFCLIGQMLIRYEFRSISLFASVIVKYVSVVGIG